MNTKRRTRTKGLEIIETTRISTTLTIVFQSGCGCGEWRRVRPPLPYYYDVPSEIDSSHAGVPMVTPNTVKHLLIEDSE